MEEMLRDQTLLDSGVHLYVDMKHTEIVRPVLHVVKQAVERWGWPAKRFVIAAFRQLDLLQVRWCLRKIVASNDEVRPGGRNSI